MRSPLLTFQARKRSAQPRLVPKLELGNEESGDKLRHAGAVAGALYTMPPCAIPAQSQRSPRSQAPAWERGVRAIAARPESPTVATSRTTRRSDPSAFPAPAD